MLMDELRILVRSSCAENALGGDIAIEKKLAPFFSLEDVSKFMPQQTNVINISGVYKYTDAGEGDGGPVF